MTHDYVADKLHTCHLLAHHSISFPGNKTYEQQIIIICIQICMHNMKTTKLSEFTEMIKN